MAFLFSLKVFFLVKLFCQVTCNKRILYHSDDDVMQLITALQSEVAEYKNKTKTLEKEALSTKSKIHILESELNVLKAIKPSIGVTYVRWGRTTCPGNGTEFIYNGYMAGADYTETGGGANNLCLPEDPTWSKYVDGYTWSKYVDGYNNDAAIYGTEIEVNSQVSNVLFGKQASEQDIPCSVCRSSRASNVMLPARANCYPGWTQEYNGYIITAHPAEHKADYVCIDAGLEFVPHGSRSDNDHVLSPVEVRCGTYGSLPCPPFVDGRELACVVCTK